MPDHASIKLLHVALAALSGGLFLGRGAWRLATRHERPLPIRTVAHAIDTLLLAAGVVLAIQLGASATRDWLPAKVIGIAVYIVLGSLALKRGRTPAIRALAFAGACLAYAYVVCVAVTRTPAGPFAFPAA